MEPLLQDVRYGIRMLRKSPGFTAIAVLSLALGIGLNTAVFSVANALLLRPLPFAAPDRLIAVEDGGVLINLPLASGGALTWKEQMQTLESVAAYEAGGSVDLNDGAEPERILTMQVSASFFTVLGVSPALGRGFDSAEEQLGSNHVVMLSHALWKRRFASDPNVIGQTVRLNAHAFTVAGVMPAGFELYQYAGKAEMWVPWVWGDDVIVTEGIFFEVIGRLAPGETVASAQAEMDLVTERLYQSSPQGHPRLQPVPLQKKFAGDIRPVLFILLGAVGCVLLIACANVANLLLARAATRQKEIAIRAALGASRVRLVQQWLIESMTLALAGGCLGLIFAWWSVDALTAIRPAHTPRLNEITIDVRVLGFTLAVSLVTGILFGLAPAIQFSKPNLNDALKAGGRQITAGPSPRFRQALMVSEIAISLVLLICGALLVSSFRKLLSVDPGFDPGKVLTLELAPPKLKYPGTQHKAAFYQQVVERIRAVPGVQSVGLANHIPFASTEGSLILHLEVEGRPSSTDERLAGSYRIISPDYFKAMGIRLLRGRSFTGEDNQQAALVTIISDKLARRAFADEDPIGKRLIVSGRKPTPFEVVGVVNDIRNRGLNVDSHPEFYLSYQQRPSPFTGVAIRMTTDARGLIERVRRAVSEVDRDLAVYNFQTLEQGMSDSISQQRFAMLLLVLFACLALVLAVVGLYGVISYAVTPTHSGDWRSNGIGRAAARCAQTRLRSRPGTGADRCRGGHSGRVRVDARVVERAVRRQRD